MRAYILYEIVCKQEKMFCMKLSADRKKETFYMNCLQRGKETICIKLFADRKRNIL